MTPRTPTTPQLSRRFDKDGPTNVLKDRLEAAFRRVLKAATAKYGAVADDPEGIDPHALAQAAKDWACELEVRLRR